MEETAPTSISGVEAVVGSAFNDSLVGSSGVDAMYGMGGNDTISAAGGNDDPFGGLGNDTLTGGGGFDYVYYNSAASAVTVNLNAGTSSGGDGSDVITATTVEGVVGPPTSLTRSWATYATPCTEAPATTPSRAQAVTTPSSVKTARIIDRWARERHARWRPRNRTPVRRTRERDRTPNCPKQPRAARASRLQWTALAKATRLLAKASALSS